MSPTSRTGRVQRLGLALAALSMPTAILLPLAAAPASATGECSGDVVFDLSAEEDLLEWELSKHQPLRSIWLDELLPEGTYDVMVHTWDGYPGRAEDEAEPEEILFVELVDDEGHRVGHTDTTADLEDGVDHASFKATFESELTAPARSINLVHVQDPESQSNNVFHVSCVGLTRVPEVEETTTTTTAPTTTTTAAPTTTTTAPAPEPEPEPEPEVAVAPAAATVSAAALPVTGRTTTPFTAAGAVFTAVGIAMVAAARRRERTA